MKNSILFTILFFVILFELPISISIHSSSSSLSSISDTSSSSSSSSPYIEFRMGNDGLAMEATRPQLYGIKAVGDKVAVGDDGVQVIHTKLQTVIYLFGHLIENINVTFTRKRANYLEDCSSLWLSGALQSVPVQDGVGRVEVTFGEPDDYFVCLHSSDLSGTTGPVWVHQGSTDHITIRAVERILPVWLQIFLLILLLTMSGLFSGMLYSFL